MNSTLYNIITLLLWFLLFSVFNAIYLSAKGKLKDIKVKKFLLFNLISLVLYTISVGFSILYFTQNIILFRVISFVLVFITGFLIDKFIVNEKPKEVIIYASLFVLVFNLFWYELFGIL